MADEIVMSSVGCKVTYEGQQYGFLLLVAGDVRHDPVWLGEWQRLAAERMAIELGVPWSMQDDDWLARFTWIVLPMTRQDWDVYCALPFEDDDV